MADSDAGQFAGSSETGQINVPRGPRDMANGRTGWGRTLFFSLIGTMFLALIRTFSAAGYGGNSPQAIAAESLAFVVLVATLGNTCLAFFDAAVTLGNWLVNLVIGRQIVPGKGRDSTGWALLYVFTIILAQGAGEFLGQLIGYGFFSGSRNDLGLVSYPNNWTDGHKLGAEIIISSVWIWLAHYASLKMYAKYSIIGGDLSKESIPDNDDRYQIVNWGRALLVGASRAAVLLGAASVGASMVNPMRYLVTAILVNTWPTPGVFLGGPFLGSLVIGLVGGFVAWVELKGYYEPSPPLGNRNVYDKFPQNAPAAANVSGGVRMRASQQQMALLGAN